MCSVHAWGLLKSVTCHQAQKRGVYAVVGALATANCRGRPGQIQHVCNVSPSVVIHQTRSPCSKTGSADDLSGEAGMQALLTVLHDIPWEFLQRWA